MTLGLFMFDQKLSLETQQVNYKKNMFLASGRSKLGHSDQFFQVKKENLPRSVKPHKWKFLAVMVMIWAL